jgi:hypothetical protein
MFPVITGGCGIGAPGIGTRGIGVIGIDVIGIGTPGRRIGIGAGISEAGL